MNLESLAFWITGRGQGEIRPVSLSAPSPDELVIRALFSGISRGTESMVFHGRVPVSEHQRMRAPFQDGEFTFPVKYGYCSVGRIEHGTPALRGRHVFVLYPHQTRYVVAETAVHVLPDHIPPERAVLAANLETAINGLWDARPHVGDRIAVIGAGAVGCLVAWLARQMPGCEVELVDVDPRREAVAQALGVRFAQPDTVGHDQDLVIHASGSPSGLDLALRIAGFEATIAELSWYGDQTVQVALGQSFHARRLRLQSSQVGTVAASQRPRWDAHRRMRLALTLLADPALDVLITGESAFEELPVAMTALTAPGGATLCHRIRYS
jgi:2-desacetyl-2-hydroxyethyl bacteriochlorophyllide A dehydrogenase